MSIYDLSEFASPLWDRAYSQAVDRFSSEKFLIPQAVLMEVAGRFVYEAAVELGAFEREVVILAGPGNNGGDALVAARLLHDAGCSVEVFKVTKRDFDPKKHSELFQLQEKILGTLGIKLKTYKEGDFERYTSSNIFVIDGIYGLGLQGSLASDDIGYVALKEIDKIQEKIVLAVDVPSGMDVDVGDEQNVPLPAAVTVTFGGLKPAHVLAPAKKACGNVLNFDIGFPKTAEVWALKEHTPHYFYVEPDALLNNDPWSHLPSDAHKYDRGHVLILGGSPGKTGAPILAGISSLRAGAGWATIAMPRSVLQTACGSIPLELTFEDLFANDFVDPGKLERFIKERKVRAVVVGPGSMDSQLDKDAVGVLAKFTSTQQGFVVIDAGAINNIAVHLQKFSIKPARWILTPHPGEWKKIGGGEPTSPLNPEGFKAARDLTERLGITVIYKCSTPVVISGDMSEPVLVTDEGSNVLARAGTGDVLSGVIAAHGAIGMKASIAGIRAQIIVARAAKKAAEYLGKESVLASDIVMALGQASLPNPANKEE